MRGQVSQEQQRTLTDGGLLEQLLHSPAAVVGGMIFFIVFVAALLAPVIAPQNPFDLAEIDLLDASLPPAWLAGGDHRYLLGTDNQGRDIFSAILYGSRVSLLVSLTSVLLAVVVGTTIGLVSGYFEGPLDAIMMRIADVQLTFPALLVALLLDGIVRDALPRANETTALFTVILAIGLSLWVQYARVVRGLTMVEKAKDYIHAEHVIGIGHCRLLLRHILPNVASSILVIATLNLAFAVIIEATLSYLGVGISASRPSLGTLIRLGSDFLYSGEWWICVFPGVALFLIVLSVNMLGDCLRDALDPRLR